MNFITSLWLEVKWQQAAPSSWHLNLYQPTLPIKQSCMPATVSHASITLSVHNTLHTIEHIHAFIHGLLNVNNRLNWVLYPSVCLSVIVLSFVNYCICCSGLVLFSLLFYNFQLPTGKDDCLYHGYTLTWRCCATCQESLLVVHVFKHCSLIKSNWILSCWNAISSERELVSLCVRALWERVCFWATSEMRAHVKKVIIEHWSIGQSYFCCFIDLINTRLNTHTFICVKMPVLSKYPHKPSKLGPKWKQTAEKQKTHV